MLRTMNQEAAARNPERKQETEAQDSAGDAGPERSSWDGSRAAIVSDDAEEFEEQQTGVRLSYTLKEQEIYDFLTGEKIRKKSRKEYLVEILCIILLFVLYFLDCLGRKSFDLPMFCLILAVSIAGSFYCNRVRPRVQSRAEAEDKAGETVRMTVYPDYILLGEEEIPLDGSWERTVTESMIALLPPETVMEAEKPILLPLRCVEPSVLPEVQAMLFAGTRPAAT